MIPQIWFAGFCRTMGSHIPSGYCAIFEYHPLPTLADAWHGVSILNKNTIRKQLLRFCRELRGLSEPLLWQDARKENVLWDKANERIYIIDLEQVMPLSRCPCSFGIECAEIMDELDVEAEVYQQYLVGSD